MCSSLGDHWILCKTHGFVTSKALMIPCPNPVGCILDIFDYCAEHSQPYMDCINQGKAKPPAAVQVANAPRWIDNPDNWKAPDPSVKNNLGCVHIWKEYYGLVESFTYCTKCDQKKELERHASTGI